MKFLALVLFCAILSGCGDSAYLLQSRKDLQEERAELNREIYMVQRGIISKDNFYSLALGREVSNSIDSTLEELLK